jgi:hypothetical protein
MRSGSSSPVSILARMLLEHLRKASSTHSPVLALASRNIRPFSWANLDTRPSPHGTRNSGNISVDPHLFQCGFVSTFFFFIPTRIRIRIHGVKTMRIHTDPDSGQTLKLQKVEFLNENILKVGNR